VWGDDWREADDRVDAALGALLDAGGGPHAAWIVRDVIVDAPLGAHLVVASSMAVRHLDRHAPQREDVVWHANRGTAGIDGTISTALGVAVGTAATSGAPVVAIVGDLALLHDSNGWLLEAAVDRLDLTVVVIDDDGGTIFDLLPPGAFPAQRRLFATPHGRDLARLTELHGVRTIAADGRRREEIERSMRRSGASGAQTTRVEVVLLRVPPLDEVTSGEVTARVARCLDDRMAH
jgi:2-succinyl-5-enolpyruvyl-6-hydroxy-3-cyclohexene-1-carboxylate synthase